MRHPALDVVQAAGFPAQMNDVRLGHAIVLDQRIGEAAPQRRQLALDHPGDERCLGRRAGQPVLAHDLDIVLGLRRGIGQRGIERRVGDAEPGADHPPAAIGIGRGILAAGVELAEQLGAVLGGDLRNLGREDVAAGAGHRGVDRQDQVGEPPARQRARQRRRPGRMRREVDPRRRGVGRQQLGRRAARADVEIHRHDPFLARRAATSASSSDE